MAIKPDVLSVEQAEALLLGLLKVGCARKKQAAEPSVIDNLISPPTERAGPNGPQVTNQWWGAAQAGLLGAGAGGLLGFGRALADKERRKRLLQETLQGALLGGGIGGGAGLFGYGLNRSLQHEGPPKPQADTPWQEFSNRVSADGAPGGLGYVNALVNDAASHTRFGPAPDAPATALTGAVAGGALLGSAGASIGRRADLSRMQYDANAPIRAHEANPGQRLHDLVVADPKARAALNTPPGGASFIGPPISPLARLNAVPSAELPRVTHTRLGMSAPEFEAWRARAVAHGRPAALPQPAISYMRRTVGGAIGGGLLGALAGSQALPRIFGNSSTPVTGHGN